MKTTIKIFVLTVSIICACGAENAEEIQKNHRIFINPDISFCLMEKGKNHIHKWKSESQQYGVQIGYEFFKPDDVYIRFSSMGSYGNVHTEMQDSLGNVSYHESRAFRSDITGNVGFTIKIEDFSLTPFSGLGWCFWKNRHYSSALAYIPVGIAANYSVIQNILEIGLRCERFQYFHFWNRDSFSKLSGNIRDKDAYGYEIAIPLSFFGQSEQGKWNILVEPYFHNLWENFSLVGVRFSTIHKF